MDGHLRPELERAAAGTTAVAVRFAARLRAAELRADLAAVIGFARALAHIDLARPDDVRAAGQAWFVGRPEERAIFDAVFDAFWLRRPEGGDLPEVSHGAAGASTSRPSPTGPRSAPPDAAAEPPSLDAAEADLDPSEAEDGTAPDETGPARLAYSAAEALRTRSFDEMTPEELRDAARLIEHLRPRVGRRRTRRFRLHHRGSRAAPRAMMRRSLATGGDQLDWLWLRRRTHPRPIVAICDVSGSMEQHSRLALRFVHALTRLDVRTESFVFGTRLTRITPHLRHRDADEALTEVAGAVRDWSGGTQIGQALHDFNRQWGRRVLRSGAIVLIVSDGWDRGDAAVVAAEMALLRRRCHRVVWLNPLAATVGYEPRTAGMVAALPYIDDLVGFRSIASLEQLGELLGQLGEPASSARSAA